jgi:hypothetical protein
LRRLVPYPLVAGGCSRQPAPARDGARRCISALAARLEREVAPIAVFAVPATPEFFSARMGCQVEQPIIGAVDNGALCVRG